VRCLGTAHGISLRAPDLLWFRTCVAFGVARLSALGPSPRSAVAGPHYSAAKPALQTLAKATARELAPEGIRVNAIAPGMVDTDLLVGRIDEDGKRRVAEGVPLGRLAVPADIADACLFLASDASAYITGVILDVNGGLHIH
jgi:NAD(P)-dependent dehydrogenase (short-subunit alcohol dehydrogenase family)